MKYLLFSILLLTSFSTLAESVFVFKKNINPKNILHFKAHVQDCELKSPAISAFWVMGEKNGQIESLSGKEIEYLKPKITYLKKDEVDFTIGAIEELEGKISDEKISVRLENCNAKAFIELDGKEIQLKEININLGAFMSVEDVTLSGLSQDGRQIKKKIEN
jgi:Domain of unknown function (DUF4833)